MFIAFEGLDGCGKSTQINMLLANQRKLNFGGVAIATSELSNTKLGLDLKPILLGVIPVGKAELLVWAAARVENIERVIRPNLGLGNLVLCDRYVYSTVAYQGYGKGISLELINQVNRLATNGLDADLTIWLDVPIEVAEQRVFQRAIIKKKPLDRIEKRSAFFYEKVRYGYQKIYENLVKTLPGKILKIDGTSDPDFIHGLLAKILKEKLATKLVSK